MNDTSPSQRNFWAITSYFNFMGNRSRRDNYRKFRRRLKLPLMTIELSHDASFELNSNDAEVLVQVRGRDVLWQKERLLNVALAQLPSACSKVAWLDCDIIFSSDDWIGHTEELLKQVALVQPFSRLIHLDRTYTSPNGNLAACSTRTSVASLASNNAIPPDLFAEPSGTITHNCNCGMAWAGRRDLLQHTGLYDAMILGMGDQLIASAAFGNHEQSVNAFKMNLVQAEHYREWVTPFAKSINRAVGCVPGDLYHLWHGDLANRKYKCRYQTFDQFNFDPYFDLMIDDGGCWRWNSEKPELKRYVSEYFYGRHEDG